MYVERHPTFLRKLIIGFVADALLLAGGGGAFVTWGELLPEKRGACFFGVSLGPSSCSRRPWRWRRTGYAAQSAVKPQRQGVTPQNSPSDFQLFADTAKLYGTLALELETNL